MLLDHLRDLLRKRDLLGLLLFTSAAADLSFDSLNFWLLVVLRGSGRFAAFFDKLGHQVLVLKVFGTLLHFLDFALFLEPLLTWQPALVVVSALTSLIFVVVGRHFSDVAVEPLVF